MVIWLILLGVCAALGLRAQTEPADALPQGSTRMQQLLTVYERNKLDARLILLTLEGPNASELAHASRQLATALRASGLFALVANGDPQVAAVDDAFFWQHRYLLSTSFTAQSPEPMQIHIDTGKIQQASYLTDPTGEFDKVTAGMRTPTANLQHDVWLSQDSTRALLYVLVKSGDATALRSGTDAIAIAHAALSSGTRLSLLGPALRSGMAPDSVNVWPIGATLMIVAVLGIAARRTAVRAIAPALAALAAGLAAAALAYDRVQISTFSFSGILISLVFLQVLIDGSITGQLILAALGASIRRSSATLVCMLAGATLLMMAPVSAVAQAALFLCGGMTAAWATMTWLSPSEVPGEIRWMNISCSRCELVRDWLAREPRRQMTLLAICCATMLAVGLASSQTRISSQQMHAETELREQLGIAPPELAAAARASTEQAALEMSDEVEPRLQQLLREGAIGGFDLPTRYLPSESAQLARQAALPESAELHALLTRALAGTRLRPEAFRAFFDDIDTARGGAVTRDLLASTSYSERVKSMLHPASGEWVTWIHLFDVRDLRSLAAVLGQSQFTLIDVTAERQTLRSSMIRAGFLSALAVIMLSLAVVWLVTRSRQKVIAYGGALLGANVISVIFALGLGDTAQFATWLPLAAGLAGSLGVLDALLRAAGHAADAGVIGVALTIVTAFGLLLIDSGAVASSAARAVITDFACLAMIYLLVRLQKIFTRV